MRVVGLIRLHRFLGPTSAARLERPPRPEDNAARIGIAGRDALRIKVAPLMPTGG
jgi:hypothetical protein